MPSVNGHPQTLAASQPGNRKAERSGVWTRRSMAQLPEVVELAEASSARPTRATWTRSGAVEIAELLVLIDKVVAGLAERGITRPKTGEPRALLDHRRRLSGQLERWLTAYGMTPAARAELLRNVATGGRAAEIPRRRAAAREQEEGQ